MRWLLPLAGLTAAVLLGGCDVTPQSLGITGPGQRVEPSMVPDDTTVQPPGLPGASGSSGSEKRYYQYN
jgi:hypothetical protein